MDIQEEIKQDVNLAELTTFKIGGAAKFMIKVKSKEELKAAYLWAKEKKEKVFIFAGGSNVLVNDQGVDGLVIKVDNDDVIARSERIDCGAGASLAQAVRLAATNHLTGLEWAAGIPGSVGGATRGNAGAFGSSMAETVETVEAFSIEKKIFELFSKNDSEFSYRSSIFKEKNSYLIWRVILKLIKGETTKIDKLINDNLNHRNNTQPKLPSAGSIFKNIKLEEIKTNNQELAKYAQVEGKVRDNKVAAGWLIELVGAKGKAIGGAKVSLEHANFIINTGRATSEDVIMLISFIKQQVRNRFKIQLQEEVQYLGF